MTTYTEEYLKNKLTEKLNAVHVCLGAATALIRSFGEKRNMARALELLMIGLGALALRAIVSLQPYSGYATPPMYGDFEAQRHWQEITVNLPISQWYSQSKDNNLTYWGLDYPPITAYHSWVMGKVAQFIDPSFVELHTSRGITTIAHKLFMRTTVIVADMLIYLPALILAVKWVWKISEEKRRKAPAELLPYFIALYYPGQILIDNGHFQYNNCSLGLACFAIWFILCDMKLLAAAFYVFALNYKQMELYHALPFFCYLYMKCFRPNFGFKNILVRGTSSILAGFIQLTCLGALVIALIYVIWMPWTSSFLDLLVVISRVFPFNRGVFEDKVSNFWCFINNFGKIRNWFSNEDLAKLCGSFTLVSVVPSCLHLFIFPRKTTFLLSLINVSLGFFLFSFQVHEKTILLVTLPVALCFTLDPFACLWFLQIATFSMTPLLIRDGLLLSYVITNVAYLIIVRLITNLQESSTRRTSPPLDFLNLSAFTDKNYMVYFFYISTVLGCSALVLGLAFVPPPAKLPHLFPVLISAYSCVHFMGFLLYFNIRQTVDYSEGDKKDTVLNECLTSATNESKEMKKYV